MTWRQPGDPSPTRSSELRLLIDRASRKIRRRWPDVDDRIAADTLTAEDVADVVAEMVQVAMTQTPGVSQNSETTGPFSQNIRYTNPNSRLYFTDDMIEVFDGRTAAQAWAGWHERRPFPFGETVTVLTAGMQTDRYSDDPEPSWDVTSSEVPVDGCALEPRVVGQGGSAEPVFDARNAVASGWTVYMPPDTVVNARNRVRIRGVVYDVLGEPADWRNPFTGSHPGIVIQAVRTEG
jgi:hypothetical protein